MYYEENKSALSYRVVGLCFLVMLCVLFVPRSAYAAYNIVWQDDFGVEEDSVVRDFADPNMSMPGYKLAATEHLGEGRYGIMNSTAWSFIKKKSVYPDKQYNFYPGGDHTGNPNGAMLVVNGATSGAGLPVYEYNLDMKVCDKRKYRFSMYVANVSGHYIFPELTLQAVNVKDPANPEVLASYFIPESEIPIWGNKYSKSATEHAHDMCEWGQASIEFEAAPGDVLQIRIINDCVAYGGNDFAIDDIMLERDDAVEIEQPIIVSGLSGSLCQPSYAISNTDLLDSWKNVYDNVYFLWQFSTDDGYTWSSIDEASGIEKTMLERDAPKTGSEVYRLVVVGGNSVAEAKSKADEFSKNGVLSDGCDYISISNTISQVEAETVPAASVGIDAISKTQQLAYDCYALSHYVVLFADDWDKRYPSGYSFLWQYSSDNGKTWNEYNETSKEFLFTDNFKGPTLFRAVLAKNDAILKKVVEKGTPDNICGEEYLITNQVSIECEQPCQVATFKPLEDDFTFCSHIRLAVGLEAVQTNQAHIEKREWFVRTEGDADWTFWDNSADNKLLVNSPGKTTWYGFVASDGKCVSDTVIFKMNVHPEIILKPIDDVKVCEGGDVELKVTVLSGKPTSYIWDSVQESTPIDEGGADAIIVDITSDLQMTLSATDGICSSDVMDVRIFVEKMPVVNVTPLPVMVCEGSSVSLNADAVLSNANTFAWKKDGVLLSDSELSLTDTPTSDATYTFSVYGDVCPVVEKTVGTTVEPKIELSLSASATEVCEGDEVTLTANELYSTPLQWLRKSVDDDKFSEFGDGDSEIKVNVENDVEFAVFNPGPQVCPRDTPVVAVKVEKKASVTLEPLPDIVCRGEIVHLVADAQLTNANKVSWRRNGTLVSVDHLTIDQMPDEDVTYTFVIKGDKCPAVEESVSTKVEQRPHIELDHYHDAVCVNSEVSVSVNVDNSPGFVWMQKKKGDEEYAVMQETGDKLSFSATESVDIVAASTGQLACQSVVTAPFYVYVEDSVHFEVVPIPDTVCLGTEIVLKSLDLSPIDSDGSLYPWYKERDWTVYDNGFAEKMPVITLKEPVFDDYQLIYIPRGNTVFEFVVEGAYCPSKVFRDSVYVVQPFDLSLSAEKYLVCEGETPKLEVQNPKNYQLVWKKRVGNDPFEVFDVDALGGLEKTTSFMVTSRETELCPGHFPNVISVVVEPKAVAEITDLPQLVCEGDEVKLDATMRLTDYNTFKWQKNGQPLSAEKQVKDVLTDDATYKLVVEGTVCPAIEVEKSVQIEKMPSVEVGVSSALVCKGDQLTLNATAENASGVKWMRKTAGGSAFEPWEGLTEMEGQITADQTSTVMAVTTGQQVCAPAASNEVLFEVETPAEVAFADFPPVVCEGASLVVDASVVAGDCSVYQWTVNSKVTSDTLGSKHAPLSLPGITVNFVDNTTITVAAGGRVCPVAEAELQVAVEKKQTLGLSVSDSVVCRGNSIELSSDYAYADGLVWESKPTGSGKYQPMGSATATIEGLPEVNTTYRVSACSELGCVEIPAELEVRVDEPAGLKVVDDFAVCEGDVALLSATTALPSDSLVWTVSGTDEVLGSEAKVSLTPEASTSYSVVAYRGVCREVQDVNVKVVEIPHISAHEDLGDRAYHMVVEDAVEPVVFNYGNADGVTESDVLTNAVYGKTYNIKVMNDYGCASTYLLQVPAFNLTFPKYFYQGDENWVVGNLERYTNTTLYIYNRYGKLLYEQKDATDGWTGVYNGNPMPTTDYWYVVDIPEIDTQYSGHFTLLRK